MVLRILVFHGHSSNQLSRTTMPCNPYILELKFRFLMKHDVFLKLRLKLLAEMKLVLAPGDLNLLSTRNIQVFYNTVRMVTRVP